MAFSIAAFPGQLQKEWSGIRRCVNLVFIRVILCSPIEWNSASTQFTRFCLNPQQANTGGGEHESWTFISEPISEWQSHWLLLANQKCLRNSLLNCLFRAFPSRRHPVLVWDDPIWGSLSTKPNSSINTKHPWLRQEEACNCIKHLSMGLAQH